MTAVLAVGSGEQNAPKQCVHPNSHKRQQKVKSEASFLPSGRRTALHRCYMLGFSRSAALRTLAMTFEGQSFCPLLITNNASAGLKPPEGHSTQMHLLSLVFYEFFSLLSNCPLFIPTAAAQNKCSHIAQVAPRCCRTSPSLLR